MFFYESNKDISIDFCAEIVIKFLKMVQKKF